MLSSIQIEGNLIASDLAVSGETVEIRGQSALDFGLKKADKLEDEIAYIWGEAKDQWSIFQRRLGRLAEHDPATSLTREYWAVPLLRLLGYDPTYQAKADVVDGQTYAISHRAGPVKTPPTPDAQLPTPDSPPIHIIGCRVKLEQKPPSGSPRISAHALVQEYLNRTEHLWAIATNGLRWRLLRDSSLMTRLTYVEFDLEQMLNGEDFAAFGVFYRLFHRTRLPQGLEDGDACLLEFYHQEAIQQGGRVRDELYKGVEMALERLGTGFLQHPRSEALRALIKSGELSDRAFFGQLLQLVYRLLFLMVAESRQLLFAMADAEKSRLYREYYSIERLRLLAERPSFTREGFEDLWQGLIVTFRLFAGDEGNWRGELLGLSPLNGQLFGLETLQVLEAAAIDNHDLLMAIRSLSLFEQNRRTQRVNYGALNAEELGSIYEKVLDTAPRLENQDGIWAFRLVAGSDRKTTGSYYTPPELVAQLIKSALEPVIADRLNPSPSGRGAGGEGTPEQAILSLKICDPACGSGHFLLAAARRLGKELARIRTGEMQPGPEPLRLATRDVIQHCIYGVDLNPLAVDLCKLALWIEGLCVGMPLSFLDHRIRCGNSLVGVMDLEVLKEGIPDDAYKPVTGDDQAIASNLKNSNKQQLKAIASGQLSLFNIEFELRQSAYAADAVAVDVVGDNTIAGYAEKVQRYAALRQNSQWWQDFSACNLWTAAFFMGLTSQNLALIPTTEALDRLLQEAKRLESRDMEQGSLFPLGETSRSTPFSVVQIVEAAHQLAAKHRFFHWPLEFPDVFKAGGFDCVLGNPPWERIKLQEKEFFGTRDPEIANAKNSAARKKLIKQLSEKNPELLQAFEDEKHFADAQSKFIRVSGRFLLTASGDINTYAVFAELDRNLVAARGFAGVIVPTGIATDATTAPFFASLIDQKSLKQLISFENEAFIFQNVHNAFKFCILTIAGSKKLVESTTFIYFCRYFVDVSNSQKRFHLTSAEIKKINPNTLTCPVFRTRQDAELTKKIYQHVPVLENEATGENSWGISFMTMFHMSNDSHLFFDQPEADRLPLYEAKMFWHFNHRYSTYENAKQADINSGRLPHSSDECLQNPDYTVTPRYWVEQSEVENRLRDRWNKNWLIAYRAISNATNQRTSIITILPKIAVGHKSPIIFIDDPKTILTACLIASLNSLTFDFVTRQKMGGTDLSYFIVKQLPVIPPDRYTQADIDYIAPRVLELVYTAHDIKPFADDLWQDATPEQRQHFAQQRHPTRSPEHQTIDTQNPENPLPPFRWDDNRRAKLRAELDAKYAQLYGLSRDELRYILDPADIHGPDFPSETFRVLKNNETKKYGEYRTQRLVLAAWDMLDTSGD